MFTNATYPISGEKSTRGPKHASSGSLAQSSGPPTGGWVTTIPDTSIDGLQDHIYAVLAGPLAGGREISWPPSHVDGEDEGILARLTFILGYDEERWNKAVFFVKEVLAFPSTQRVMKSNFQRTAQVWGDPQ